MQTHDCAAGGRAPPACIALMHARGLALLHPAECERPHVCGRAEEACLCLTLALVRRVLRETVRARDLVWGLVQSAIVLALFAWVGYNRSVDDAMLLVPPSQKA